MNPQPSRVRGARRWYAVRMERATERCKLCGMAHRRRAESAGFTLAELMVVVVIVGVLAVIAVVAIRSYMFAARANEAAAMIQSIRAAQEAYRAETNTYLDVSDSMKTWHPDRTPDQNRVAFTPDTSAQGLRWRLLDPSAPGEGVRWVYVTKAGPAGSTPVDFEGLKDKPVWGGPQPRAWYVIEAMGDTDGDGHAVYMAASSVTGAVYDESAGD
jgi:type IV pilus assembly protein PilA